jgi:hypothetical protein
MKLSQNVTRISLVAAVAMLAACGDSSVAPTNQRSLSIDRPVLDKLLGTTTITYNPSDLLWTSVGNGSMIFIPSYGVCDPATSSYGPGTWDSSCDVLTRPLTITASTFLDAKGHTYIQFKPALRFVASRTAILYVADSKSTLDASANIIYCPDSGSCLDESKTDASLWTYHWQGGVYRRIKHFSGYNVAAGLDDLIEGLFSRSAPKGGVSANRGKKSGYMVVSGVERPGDANDQTNYNRPDDEDDQE